MAALPTTPPPTADDNPIFFGNCPTPWADLTLDQKLARSSPNPLKKQIGGYYAWRATGDLRAQWNQLGVDEYTKAVGSVNDLQLGFFFRKEKIVLSYDIRLLCVTNTRESAVPYIIVTSNNAKASEAAINKIKHHSSLSSYRYECIASLTGIVPSSGEELDQSISGPQSAEDNHFHSGPISMSTQVSLCGARIGVYAHNGRTPSSKKNVATIGGVFRVDGKYFALTAAHAFYGDIESTGSWVDSGLYVTVDRDSDCRESQAPNPRTYDMYDIVLESFGQSTPTNAEKQLHAVSQSIGLFVPTAGRRRRLPKDSDKPEIILKRDLDWALIELRDPKFWTTNVVSSSSGQQLTLKAPPARQQPPENDMELVTGLSGVVTGPGLGTASGIMLPWSGQKFKAWSLECEICIGDCGSLAFDPNTGEVYGMVIVHDPDTLLTYLVPAPDLFESIACYFPQSTTSVAELFDFDSKRAAVVSIPASSKPLTPAMSTLDEDTIYQAFLRELRTATKLNADGERYVLVKRLKQWLLAETGGYLHFVHLLDRCYAEELVLPIQPSTVRDESNPLLIVFALLLQHDMGHLLHVFSQLNLTDSKLPFARETLGKISVLQSHQAAELWNSQWAYCPVNFTLDVRRRLLPQEVLPIQERTVINNKGAKAHITSILVLEEFISPRLCQYLERTRYDPGVDGLGPRYRMALKTFATRNEEFFFLELNAFEVLRNTKGIVRCLGSFTQADKVGETTDGLDEQSHRKQVTGHILLEYGQLDLDEFFHSQEYPPIMQSEIIAFWQDLITIVETIAAIHDMDLGRMGKSRKLHGWHSDIKPDNILLVDGQFKLSDPGFTRFEDSGTDKTQLLGGTTLFGAPETISTLRGERPSVSRASDIWSLGCVFSVAATWVVGGTVSVDAYGRIRIQAKKGFAERSNYKTVKFVTNSDAFHDGNEVLEVVRDWHEFLRRSARRSDGITSKVLDLVDSDMLVADASARISASELSMKMRGMLVMAELERDELSTGLKKLLRSSAYSSNSVSGQESRPLESTYESLPNTTTSQRVSEAPRSRDVPVRTVESPSRISPSAGLRSGGITTVKDMREELEETQKRSRWFRVLRQERRKDALLSTFLKNRRIMFLVDNARSMDHHWDEMTVLLETFVQMLAGQNKDGLYIQGMAGNFRARVKTHLSMKDEVKLDKILDDPLLRLSSGAVPGVVTDPRPALGKFVTDCIENAKKLGSRAETWTVIILTDGFWMGMVEHNALDAFFVDVGRKLSAITDASLKQRLMSFQFVQFGSDPGAVKRLRHLEDNLSQFGINGMIDAEPSTGDVYKMLLGSFVDITTRTEEEQKRRV